jgi:hypothetical protein
MKINEIDLLRKLADFIADKQTGADAGDQPSGAESGSNDPDAPMYDEDGTRLVKQPDDKMVPPLQLKLELLKRAVDVENIYSENNGDQDPLASNYKTTPMSEDEREALESMKRAAGVNALIRNEMSDDEPLDS